MVVDLEFPWGKMRDLVKDSTSLQALLVNMLVNPDLTVHLSQIMQLSPVECRPASRHNITAR